MTAWRYFTASLLLAAFATFAPVAGEDAMPETAEPAARDCRVAAQSAPANEIWWTVFYGERDKVIGESHVREWTREVRCFTDPTACMEWRDWAATRWPDHGYPRPCLAGLPAWLQGPET